MTKFTFKMRPDTQTKINQVLNLAVTEGSDEAE